MNPALALQRRTLLQALAAAVVLPTSTGKAIAGDTKGNPATDNPSPPPGKPGDFDFLTGEWKIHHRQLQADTNEWIEFDGEATCWSMLGGVAHVEELRIPARDFSGMGLRVLDQQTRVWSDFWVNAKSGALGGAGQPGHFIDGKGIFESREIQDGNPVIHRGVWDRIVPGRSHRWHQASSRDGGRTWDVNWEMDWRRA